MVFSNRTYKGRKKRVMTVDFIINKMQRGLEGTASVSHRRSILTSISENISGLILKNHNKEIRNNGRDRRKRLLILKIIYSGIWEV